MHPLFNSIGHPILVASHPRSGTHLTIDLLRKQFSACATHKFPTQPFDRLYLALEALSAPPQKSISEAQARKILQKPQRPIIKTHADPQLKHLDQTFSHWQEWLSQEATTLYIIRDGRAVMCSLHLFMQSYDASTRCSLSEFIRQTVNGKSRVKQWANHVEQWLSQPKVHPIRFEDIVKDTSRALAHISDILQIEAQYREPLLPKSIHSLWQGRWLRLTATNPESSAIIGYYNQQKTLKWQQAFTTDDYRFFHQEAGDVLMRLQYIEDEHWTENLKPQLTFNP